MGLPLMTEISAPPANYLRMQYFPAQVTGLSNTPPPTDLKAVVTDSHLILITTSPVPTSINAGAGAGSESFAIVFVGVLESYEGFNYKTRSWELTLDTGERVSIARAPTCGCGSRLRGFQLYPNLRVFR